MTMLHSWLLQHMDVCFGLSTWFHFNAADVAIWFEEIESPNYRGVPYGPLFSWFPYVNPWNGTNQLSSITVNHPFWCLFVLLSFFMLHFNSKRLLSTSTTKKESEEKKKMVVSKSPFTKAMWTNLSLVRERILWCKNCT